MPPEGARHLSRERPDDVVPERSRNEAKQPSLENRGVTFAGGRQKRSQGDSRYGHNDDHVIEKLKPVEGTKDEDCQWRQPSRGGMHAPSLFLATAR
jgi:hypothetical protein